MKSHGKELRKGRYSCAGNYYHITTVTKDREKSLANLHTARILIQSLRYADEQGWATSLSFVVMPDHLHWLFELGEMKTLDKLVASVKRYSSTRVSILEWQEGFYDHGIRKDEDLKSVARYIVANPLRAGLVESITDYSHWDSIWM